MAAEEAGYGLLFVSPVYGSLARAVGRATVDGFVAIGLSEEHPEVGQIRTAGLPIVLVDSAAFPEHAAVDVDDEGGARMAAEHLLALGHRDFLVVGVEPPIAGRAPRLRGRRGTPASPAIAPPSQNAGVELPDSHVVVGPASIDGGAACFTRAWEDGLRPTAVLAMSDVMAIGAIGAAARLGLDVPADLSVVGFDDIELGQPHPARRSRPCTSRSVARGRRPAVSCSRRSSDQTRRESSTATSRPGSSSGARAARCRAALGSGRGHRLTGTADDRRAITRTGTRPQRAGGSTREGRRHRGGRLQEEDREQCSE